MDILKEQKRRQDLAVLNSCGMRQCVFLINEICTHAGDKVDKKGYACCPLTPGSVQRENFKG